MYLLLGDQDDLCLVSLQASLRGRGCEAEIVPAVFSQTVPLTWAHDVYGSRTRLILENGKSLSDEDINGVVVRRRRSVRLAGWNAEDYFFVEAEHQAALIGWLWSLRCVVINRLPAAVWFHHRLPLAFWNSVLRVSGLSPVESLLSNVEQDIRAYCRDNRGAIYTPLTGDGQYPL